MRIARCIVASVAAKTLSMSGRLILEALVAGQRDPAVLADFAKGKLRVKIPALREALDRPL
jgi:hypothetical protein